MVMIKPTLPTAASAVPVVHILSPSPEASRRFRDRLVDLFGWSPFNSSKHAAAAVDNKDNNADPLSFWNQAFGRPPSFVWTTSPRWDSVALECPTTGTLIHWISLQQQQQQQQQDQQQTLSSSSRKKTQFHELLGIVETSNPHESLLTSLAQSIRLARSSSSTSSTWPLLLRHYLKQRVSLSHLIGNNSILLDLLESSSDQEDKTEGFLPNSLKEIAVATPDTANYSLLERLSRSSLHRPVSGVYQLPGASKLSLRPLPAATGDRGLSPPSLIFHCESLAQVTERMIDMGVAFQADMVGRTGARAGQIRLRHADFNGLDIRLCQETKTSSMFAEAQEALLAGSLDELQSHHVLQRAQGSVDPKTERMDCWVEFRANLKNPRGFLKSLSSSSTKPLKAPDIPYE